MTNSAGFKRGEADFDIDDAEVAIRLGGGLAVALHVEGFVGRGALEGALAEEAVHEGADVEPDVGPERLVVRLKHDPLGAAIERLLEEQGQPPDRDVFPFRADVVRAVHGARAPVHKTGDEGAGAVDAEFVEHAVFEIGQFHFEPDEPAQIRLRARGRFPDAAAGVDPRHQTGDRAGGTERAHDAAIVHLNLRIEDGAVVFHHRRAQGADQRRVLDNLRTSSVRPIIRRLDEQEGAARLAVNARRPPDGRTIRGRDRLIARDDHEVENVHLIEGMESGLRGGIADVIREAGRGAIEPGDLARGRGAGGTGAETVLAGVEPDRRIDRGHAGAGEGDRGRLIDRAVLRQNREFVAADLRAIAQAGGVRDRLRDDAQFLAHSVVVAAGAGAREVVAEVRIARGRGLDHVRSGVERDRGAVNRDSRDLVLIQAGQDVEEIDIAERAGGIVEAQGRPGGDRAEVAPARHFHAAAFRTKEERGGDVVSRGAADADVAIRIRRRGDGEKPLAADRGNGVERDGDLRRGHEGVERGVDARFQIATQSRDAAESGEDGIGPFAQVHRDVGRVVHADVEVVTRSRGRAGIDQRIEERAHIREGGAEGTARLRVAGKGLGQVVVGGSGKGEIAQAGAGLEIDQLGALRNQRRRETR